jgi:glutamyl/glutaminyl-tRNA synthetase
MVQSSGAVFNIDKLNWMNNSYIKDYDLDKLAELSVPYFKDTGIDITDTAKIRKILSAIRVYLNKLDEIPDQVKIFTRDEIILDNENLKELLQTESSRKAFTALAEKFGSLDEINTVNYKNTLSEVQAETGIKGKLLFKPLRRSRTACYC